ncbi:MAG: hypothetical protein U0800_16290 [Isosphaeraceae bacterium]
MLTTALLAVCIATPVLLARVVHPAAGLVAAFLAAVLWSRVVRPTPGYVQGLVSLSGLAVILAVALACIALWLRPPPNTSLQRTPAAQHYGAARLGVGRVR